MDMIRLGLTKASALRKLGEFMINIQKAAERNNSLIDIYIEYDCGAYRCGIKSFEEIDGLIKMIKMMTNLNFVGFQAYEYMVAYNDLNLKMTSGIYGSTFYMLTGFHGFHVTLGAIMLTVIFFRCLKGHFAGDNHFGFEAVAWYWHFVDVVWLGLFVFVYWL